MLLRELEEARGTVVRMPGDDDDSMDVSSSSAVITSQLVTFKSVSPTYSVEFLCFTSCFFSIYPVIFSCSQIIMSSRGKPKLLVNTLCVM